MTTQQTVLNDLLKTAFGLDRYVTHASRIANAQSFPPFNISVNDATKPTEYLLELAVAGFSKDQISVKVRQETGISLLVIEGKKEDTLDADSKIYLNRGLAARNFKREFTMADEAKVIATTLKDGILSIVIKMTEIQEVEKIIDIL